MPGAAPPPPAADLSALAPADEQSVPELAAGPDGGTVPGPPGLPYPPFAPRAVLRLRVGGGHVLHVEDGGAPQGVPVVFLHGGPGAGGYPWQGRLFDPHVWRIILFDQRGAGRSTPSGGLAANTSADLVGDLEWLRRRLGIARWVLAGGSWGATLALLYAQTFPERCRGLLLRGTFLARPQDLAWFYAADGVARLLPDAWSTFLAPLSCAERAAPVPAYYQRLTSGDHATIAAAAHAWHTWGSAVTSPPPPSPSAPPTLTARAIAQARIEAHYVRHGCFIEPDRLLRDAAALAGLPGMLLHGAEDRVCPIAQAQALHAVWPDAELRRLPGVGHVLGDPGMLAAWLRAAQELLDRV